MGEKKKKIYHALVEGATTGLTDKALFAFVQDKCPKTSSKGIVRASLLALSGPDLRDGNILNTIYALAIKHRLDAFSPDDSDDATDAPQISTKNDQKPAPKAKQQKVAKPEVKSDAHNGEVQA
ncbi:hypothetical protein U8C40_28550 (plasmid) [Sinorhizobium medicae]|uniref:hypothetical protein n=1 Tax=Sinorhizobium medicae TaxID=110321 RepID=UPI002AF6C708|nr:hypothetical protein [Sinorhizobium medicae]WQO48361.1 hypothetical protein U8C42_27290 [Sinorhizobium medicae]WQO68776.1 hypothetical protein U8C40_28550 [Sinorhizobium medicae]WQO75815.1 hypothetical protein U8C31_28075 [Sinorhizobium medicae]